MASNIGYNIGAFKGRLTGKTYGSIEEMRHMERLEAMRRNVPTEEEAAFENLPAEKIKQLFEKASKSEQEKADMIQASLDTGTWVAMHAEYVDCDHNSQQMKHYLHSRGIKAPTLNELEEAYESLRAHNLLQLNQAALVQKENDRIRKRAREIEDGGGIRALGQPPESEDELYSLPLDEIRRRATVGGWNR